MQPQRSWKTHTLLHWCGYPFIFGAIPPWYVQVLHLTLSAPMKSFGQSSLNLRENRFRWVKLRAFTVRQLLQSCGNQTHSQSHFPPQQGRLGLNEPWQLLPPQQPLQCSLKNFLQGFVQVLQMKKKFQCNQLSSEVRQCQRATIYPLLACQNMAIHQSWLAGQGDQPKQQCCFGSWRSCRDSRLRLKNG